MCCNNAFCNADADIENFEARQPKIGTAEQPTNQVHLNRGGNTSSTRQGGNPAGGSVYSGSYSYERGATNVLSHGNDYSGFNAATSNHGMYEEPQVDVLANSRRAQLAEALGPSAQKQNE